MLSLMAVEADSFICSKLLRFYFTHRSAEVPVAPHHLLSWHFVGVSSGFEGGGEEKIKLISKLKINFAFPRDKEITTDLLLLTSQPALVVQRMILTMTQVRKKGIKRCQGSAAF